MTIRIAAACGLLTLLSIPLLAQPAAAPTTAAFDIADVHASPPLKIPAPVAGDLSGDRYELRQSTMTQIIAAAYNLDPDHVQGGPTWLDWDHYDIEAKTQPTASKQTIRLMLQSLLAQRFNLVVHNGTAPIPAYVLTAPNGKAKLNESAGTGDSGCKPQPMSGPPAPGSIPEVTVACRNETMEQFAALLRSNGLMTLGDTAKPLIDSTGLEGRMTSTSSGLRPNSSRAPAPKAFPSSMQWTKSSASSWRLTPRLSRC